MRIVITAALLLSIASGAVAEELVCGTSEAMLNRVADLDLWVREGNRASAKAGNNVVERNGIYLLPADDINAPFRKPFDLGTQRTIAFNRKDAASFTAETIAFEWDSSYGTNLGVSSDGPTARSIGFDFPFYGRTTKSLKVSAFNAIYIDDPRDTDVAQYSDLDLATQRQGVIAPLLSTADAAPMASVYVKETADFARFTWVAATANAAYDLQATLHKSGRIVFSYRVQRAPFAGAIVIAPGNNDWRGAATSIASHTDAKGDAPGFLDIETASVHRVAGSDLLELRIDLAGNVDRSLLPEGEYVSYGFSFGDPAKRIRAQYYVFRDPSKDLLTLPGWGTIAANGIARVEGDKVTIDVLQAYLPLTGATLLSAGSASLNTIADTATFTANIGAAARNLGITFRELASREVTGPIFEAFTLPVINVAGAWEQVKAAFPFKDADVDGVAIYQNFYSDVVVHGIGAYSTGGNGGMNGVINSSNVGTTRPKTPALLHMNAIGWGHNATQAGAGRVLSHELGHRWLYHFSIRVNGQNRRVLNPVSGHPAQFVNTPAAFKVINDYDSSTMGGGTFKQNTDGSYTTWPARANYGFSWTDLYLMGLASPSEVQPWWYLANATPELGGEYYPPANRTYRGTRTEVSIDQVVAAMGPRVPAYPDTQRKFKVAFVVLTEPGREVTQAELEQVAIYRSEFVAQFGRGTGGRGEIVPAALETAPPRRRSVR